MVKDTTKGINGGQKDFTLLKADVSTLPLDVADGSSAFIVDTYELLTFHDGHWYDGSGVVL